MNVILSPRNCLDWHFTCVQERTLRNYLSTCIFYPIIFSISFFNECWIQFLFSLWVRPTWSNIVICISIFQFYWLYNIFFNVSMYLSCVIILINALRCMLQLHITVKLIYSLLALYIILVFSSFIFHLGLNFCYICKLWN